MGIPYALVLLLLFTSIIWGQSVTQVKSVEISGKKFAVHDVSYISISAECIAIEILFAWHLPHS